jgi:hypothetical protein
MLILIKVITYQVIKSQQVVTMTNILYRTKGANGSHLPKITIANV